VAEDDAPLDLDQVVAEIRAAVEARTASGEYDADLDERLRSRVVALDATAADELDAVARAIDAVAARATFGDADAAGRAGADSGLARLRRSVEARTRNVDGVVRSLDEFGASVIDALRALADVDRSARHEVDSVQDRLADVERTLRRLRGALDAMVERQQALEARLRRLETGDAAGA
jgi:hypothetical protein